MTSKREVTNLESANERIRHLEALVDASKNINSTLDLEQLLNLILATALKNTNAEAGTIYLLDEERREIWSKVVQGDKEIEIRLPCGRGIAGTVAERGEIINLKDAYADPRFDKEYDRASGFVTRDILCMPMRDKSGKIIGVFQVLNKISNHFVAEDEEFLDALSIHASLAVDNAKLYGEALEKKRLDSELAIAREIQEHLLPAHVPKIQGYEFAALNNPCFQVGGDYFDFIERSRGNLGFAIGDVSGKGIPASLLMATLRGGLHAQIGSRQSLLQRIKNLNNLICQCTTAGRFITFFHGELHPDKGEISYINCGHNPPIYMRMNGTYEKLEAGGLILGLLEKTDFEMGKIALSPGEFLVLYTDGVTEAVNKRNQEYEILRLIKAMKKSIAGSAKQMLDCIVSSVNKYSAGVDQGDDITLMVIKRVN